MILGRSPVALFLGHGYFSRVLAVKYMQFRLPLCLNSRVACTRLAWSLSFGVC